MHFIGASTVSGDWAAMLRRIMGELQQHFQLDGEIPEESNALREAFPEWLLNASQKGKVLLILDALNQLEDKQGAQELTWLPQELPQNIQMVVSTLPGKSLNAVQERGYSVLTVEPLTLQEREQFASVFLAQYAKRLNSQQMKTIVESKKTSNPLTLRILLDELRQFGSYERLDETIQYYLQANSVIEMLELVFKRWENDYEAERPGLVKDTLCSIWAARQGLTESELMDLLGTEGTPLAQGIWSPLHLALGQSLLEHGGFLNFSHDYIRQAVETHYLAAEEDKQAAHRQMAEYFNQKIGYPKRKVAELPWQWQRSGEWKLLYELLADPHYFLAQWALDRDDLFAYWTAVEENSNFDRVEAYAGVLDRTKDQIFLLMHPETTSFLNGISLLLMNTGHMEEAMRFLREQERICRESGKKNDLQAALGNQALILKATGKLEEAMRLLKAQEEIYRVMGNQDGLQRSLGNQALILQSWGRFEEAMQMHKEKEQICRQLGNRDGIQTAIGNQALVLKATGKLEDAMRLYKEQERICRELGNQNALQMNLGNQGLILNIWNRREEAMRMQEEKERICRELGDLDGIQIAIGNRVVILQAERKFEEGLRLLSEKERICYQIKSIDGLCTTWVYQGSIYLMSGHKEMGLSLLRKAYEQALQNKFSAMAAKIKVMLDKFS